MNGYCGEGSVNRNNNGATDNNNIVLLKIDSVRCRSAANGHSGSLILFESSCGWKDGNGTIKVVYPYEKIKSRSHL